MIEELYGILPFVWVRVVLCARVDCIRYHFWMNVQDTKRSEDQIGKETFYPKPLHTI